MTLVLHHSRTRGTAKLVLLGIANHDGDGGAWPSLDTLATYANVDERNVRAALRQLEASGELVTQLQDGGTRDTLSWRRPNRYVLQLRCPLTCDRTSRHRCTVPGCSKGASTCGHADVVHRGDAGIPRGGMLASPGGGMLASPEPSVEPSLQPGGSPSSIGDHSARVASPVDCEQPEPDDGPSS